MDAQFHPAITTDIVVFGLHEERAEVALVERPLPPYAGVLALPGGHVGAEEDLERSAKRILAAKTGIADAYLEQLFTFGDPKRDPRERTISVAYYALLPSNGVRPGLDGAAWYPLDQLPELAFDHAEIIELAHERLAGKLHYSTIALELLPEQFTLSQLQSVYETVLREPVDKRNFRKKVLAWDCLEPTGDSLRLGNHRPAKLYRAKVPDRVTIIK
jgi:8-oxo-dGTP diphosphatase